MTPQQAFEQIAALPLIKFSRNWNGKLYTDTYTTIRLRGTYKVGELYHALLKSKNGTVEVKTKSGKIEKYNSLPNPVHFCKREVTTTLGNLKENECFVDTGYDLATTKDIIRKMYSNIWQAHGENMKLSIYVFDQTNLFLNAINWEEKMETESTIDTNKDFVKMLYDLTGDNTTVTLERLNRNLHLEMEAVGKMQVKSEK